MPGLYYKPQEEIKSRLNECMEYTKNIARSIVNREKVSIQGSYISSHGSKLISPSYLIQDSRPHNKEFSISDNCNKYGLYTKVCPVINIKIENRNHIFAHNCQRCMACIQYCPRQAFQVKGKPMNKERYTNPFVSVNEIIGLRHGDTNLKAF